MTGNDFVKLLLRTPFHVFVSNTMLITVTGCKTGRKYSTPVSFYREGDVLWVISSRDRTWWRNVRNGANVSLLLNGKAVSAFAETEINEDAIERRLLDYIRHMPMSAKSFGIRMEKKIPNPQDVERVAKEKLFVKIEPSLVEDWGKEKQIR